MRTFISRIPGFIGRLAAAALAATLIYAAPAAASADTPQQRALGEMNRGMDYSAAWAAASRASGEGYSRALIARARAAERALAEGQDYPAAWHAADSSDAPEQLAGTRRIEEGLRSGKDYVAARSFN